MAGPFAKAEATGDPGNGPRAIDGLWSYVLGLGLCVGLVVWAREQSPANADFRDLVDHLREFPANVAVFVGASLAAFGVFELIVSAARGPGSRREPLLVAWALILGGIAAALAVVAALNI